MAISASDVKKLREMTNVGMMDRKRPSLPATAIWMQQLITFVRRALPRLLRRLTV